MLRAIFGKELPSDFPADPKEGVLRCRFALAHLSYRKLYVILRRFGLTGTKPPTLMEIGEEMSVTRERIRQLILSGLGYLRRTRHDLLLADVDGLACLHLPTRASNALKWVGITAIPDLIRLSPCELAVRKNIGPKTVHHIVMRLKGLGLSLNVCGPNEEWHQPHLIERLNAETKVLP